MFDMRSFIKTNLLNGYHNGAFTKEQVAIYAVQYVARGWLTEADLDEIRQVIDPPEDEQ